MKKKKYVIIGEWSRVEYNSIENLWFNLFEEYTGKVNGISRDSPCTCLYQLEKDNRIGAHFVVSGLDVTVYLTLVSYENLLKKDWKFKNKNRTFIAILNLMKLCFAGSVESWTATNSVTWPTISSPASTAHFLEKVLPSCCVVFTL